MLSVLLISDVHGRISLLKKIVKTSSYDLALVAGDISNYSGGAYKEVLEVLSENLPLSVVVPGNVDPPEVARLNIRGILVVHKDVVEARGIYVAGIGGGIGFPFWDSPHLTDERLGLFVRELEHTVGSRSVKLHVLVTHTPPHASGLDKIYSGEHVGSRRIREFVEKYSPVLHVCGHIHEGRGVTTIGRTVTVNPGPAMVGYYAVAKLLGEGERVEVELKKL